MTNIRRAIATFSLVAILSSFVVSTAVADTFKDVLPGDYFYEGVEALAANGTVDNTAGTFSPNAPLPRGEAVKYLVREAGYTLVDPATARFGDVAKGSPYYKYVETAVANGIVGGYPDGTFKPAATVSRAEFAKMSVLAFEFTMYNPATGSFKDVFKADWFFDDVETAAKYGVVLGYASGNFGPADLITKGQGATMTFRAVNADTTPVVDPDEPEDDEFDENGGTEGSIDEITKGTPDETEALEGEEDVEVYSLNVKMDDNGPLQLQRADFYFGLDNDVTADTKPWEYFTEISLTLDGAVVATLDTDSSSDWGTKVDPAATLSDTDTEYRLRFTGLTETLSSDQTTKLALRVSIKDALDSDDEDAVWWMELSELRTMDETGFVSTYSDHNPTTTTTLEEDVGMSEEKVAIFGYGAADEEVPEQLIQVSKTSDTNGVEIYAFELEETNGVDANISEMTLQFTTLVSTTESDVMRKAYLLADGEVVGEESMENDGEVLFDNMDIDIDADATVEFSVEVDFEDTNAAAATDRYEEGTTVAVYVVAINEVSDTNGHDEDDIYLDGTSAGTLTFGVTDLLSGTHELRTEGVMFAYSKSTTAVVKTDAADDQGEYTVEFTARAFGADQYIDLSALVYDVVEPTSATFTDDADYTSTSDHDNDSGDVYFLAKDATARTFTLTVIVTPTDSSDTGFYKVTISSFAYGETDGNEETYNFDLGDYKTGSKYLTGV